ncbi:Protein CASP [Auxenochlorella protothecoides]|uniref:Protein CASP n=1 Tax=Auxenochlorella protothecoides TaxID=3075 RepID=A0A087SQ01_AUXPR|nr:Protein CASP [Auxenochlorella protothecoides]KFM27805.1 Protein CASP [Auxenochlorella protothecoides]
MALAEAQEASLRSRKELAGNTKELRKKLPPEVSKEVGPLLRAYQEEIDRLTNRAKTGESAFLELYQRLYDAPDPTPSLALGVELASKCTAAEARANRLAQELAEYKEESSALRNQDLTIRRLEEKVRSLEAQVEEKDRQVKESKRSAAEEAQEAIVAEMRQREERLADELAQAQASVEAMRRLHQASQTQVMTMQSRSEEEQVNLRSELDLAVEEMERAQARLALLEKEHEAMLEKAQGERSGEGSSAPEPVDRSGTEEALRQELYVQRELAGRLASELRAAREELAQSGAAADSKLEGVRALLEAQSSQSAALEAALASRPTQEEVAELRQQVRLLQTLGYGESAGAEGLDGVTAALAERSRRLEHELTLARLAATQAQSASDAAEAQAASLASELEAAQQLAGRLEEDLVLAQRQAPSMLAVMSGQRDRFRARVRELEEHLLVQTQQLARAGNDLEAARADNLALAERLKYVQSYGRVQAEGDVESGADAVGRYMKQYEDGVNPFNAFRAKERTAATRGMPLTERAAYRIGAVVAGSRTARSALMAYALVLHCVIFLVLARSAHKDMSAMTSIEASCSKLAAAQALNAAVPALNATATGDVLRAVDPVTGAQGRRLLGALLALVRGR